MGSVTMENLTDQSLRALEYDRILELLAEQCSCADSAGKAHALRPFADVAQAEREIARAEAAGRLTLKFGGPSFSGLADISPALHRAKIGSALSAGELLQVATVLGALRRLRQYRETAASESTCLDEAFDSLAPNKYLEEKINAAILSEEEIADAASPALSDIRRHIRRQGERVREQMDRMTRSQQFSKYLQDPIVTIRDGRFVVPVRAECRANVPGLIHDTSASGATVFIEPMAVVELNNDLRVLASQEKKEIERILQELSDEVGGFSDAIADSRRIAVELDFVFAKSRLADRMKASAPVFSTDGTVELRRVRHPLLDPKKAVPIDIRLGGDFDTLVITGPNTGGKTVALKTLGLTCLMAMSGLPVPAGDGSKVGFFTRVLADIGDEQSIEQSLSTFSSHMTHIIKILRDGGKGCLVLLDELGSGTDPVEGAALAVAILEHLKAAGARTAATTHYAELKVYALQTPGVENACCEFNVETLRPTYRLLIGVPGRSNAFAISERLGLPPEIIARAGELITGENARFEEVVQGLEASRQQMEQERERAAQLRMEAEKSRNEAGRLQEELRAAREKEMERARVDARRIVERSRAQAQQLLDELDELRKMRETEDIGALRDMARSEVKARMKELERTSDPVAADAAGRKRSAGYRLPRPLRAGDTVLIADVNRRGTVLSPPDASGSVAVQAGIIMTRVPVAGLRLVEDAPAPSMAGSSVRAGIDRAHREVKTELDLRGMTVEEALLELDAFLDDAVLAGLGQVRIIHGKGTGALRSAVQQHLRGHRQIKSFRLGRYGEGETGVTVAELQ